MSVCLAPARIRATIAGTCALCLFMLSQGNAAEPNRPNIVFLLADDLGWTGLGCFGSDLYETPNLDQLAQQGMMFTDAYAACTVCSPTRASVMTGMYPARLHLTDFIAGQNRPFAKLKIPDWKKYLPHETVTIAEALREAGYATGHVGKWHLDDKSGRIPDSGPTGHGFDVSFGKPRGTKGYFLNEQTSGKSNYLTDYLTDRAIEFVGENKHQPFFLYFAYNVPHTPIQGRADLVEYFQGKVSKDAVHTNPVYAAMVSSLDQSVGRIVESLKQHGLFDKTLIVFLSDNGGLTQRYGKRDLFTENLPLRRGKGSAFEGGVRVPCIVRWPGTTPPGSQCQVPIISNDFYPTILKIAGIDIPQVADNESDRNRIDGMDLTALLAGSTVPIERDLFWHYPHYHAGGDGPYSAIRSGGLRLIEFHEDQSVRLYDLTRDIGEKDDLSAKMPDVTSALRNKLSQWRTSVGAQMPTINPNFDPDRQTVVGGKKQPPQQRGK